MNRSSLSAGPYESHILWDVLRAPGTGNFPVAVSTGPCPCSSPPVSWACLILLGYMTAGTQVTSFFRLRLCSLQSWLMKVYPPNRVSLEKKFLLPSSVWASLNMREEKNKVCAGDCFTPTPPKKTHITDASLLGWGVHLDDYIAQTSWATEESTHHINLLQLWAVCEV